MGSEGEFFSPNNFSGQIASVVRGSKQDDGGKKQ